MMIELFDSLDDAVVYLHTNGWRQEEETGDWLKGKCRVAVRRSPANDGVVSVVSYTRDGRA